MPLSGVVGSARSSYLPNKTGLIPLDMIPDDPNIPAGAVGGNAAPFLNTQGYRPRSDWVLPWLGGLETTVTFRGSFYKWAGSHWFLSSSFTSSALTTGQAVNVSMTSNVPYAPLISRADRVAVFNKRYTANPATPWGAGLAACVGGCLIRWDGTSWQIVGHPPSNTDPKPLSPSSQSVEPTITAADAANAAKIAGLGYTSSLLAQWRNVTSLVQAPPAFFYSDTAIGSNYQFHWNGTAWSEAARSTTMITVAVGATITNAAIAALADDERCIAAAWSGHRPSTTTQWTAGQSATIGGKQMFWRFVSSMGYWSPGTAP